MNILEYLRNKNISNIPSPCGGRGTCGKCRVTVIYDDNGRKDKAESGPVMQQVLACQTEYKEGMTIILPDQPDENNMEIVDSVMNPIIYSEETAGEATGLAIACDIGTTTVVCHLIDSKGRALATAAHPNVQQSYGADVISRIEAAKKGRLAEMRAAITNQLGQMIGECLESCNRAGERVKKLVIAGNTVMCHLFTGLSPESIGRAPFMPQEYFGRWYTGEKLGLADVDSIYIMPAVSGYVGGDITSDMLYIDMCMQDRKEQDKIVQDKADSIKKEMLILDIGTNGEMVLGRESDYTCCAAAAGPAFEGAEIELGMSAVPGAVSRVWVENDEIQVHVIGDGTNCVEMAAKGICGSGLVDALYVFLQLGLVDETGMIKPKNQVPYRYHRYLGDEDEENDCIFLTEEVYISQDDIRKLQLAKGAVAAGIAVLMKARTISCDEIEKVVIAGGFGSVLDKFSAAGIGMIPAELVDRTEAAGNAAAAGAVIAALRSDAGQRLDKIKKSMKYIELSSAEGFSEEYVRQMKLGRMNIVD